MRFCFWGAAASNCEMTSTMTSTRFTLASFVACSLECWIWNWMGFGHFLSVLSSSFHDHLLSKNLTSSLHSVPLQSNGWVRRGQQSPWCLWIFQHCSCSSASSNASSMHMPVWEVQMRGQIRSSDTCTEELGSAAQLICQSPKWIISYALMK